MSARRRITPKATGVADDTRAIQAAIAACPNGRAVYLPAGSYKITGPLFITRKSIVLRGAGPAKTRLLDAYTGDTPNGSSFCIRFKGWSTTLYADVVKGFQKGSTKITVADAAKFNTGDYVEISQKNDPAVIEGNIPSPNFNYQGQLMRVIEKRERELTLDRTLYYSYNPAMQIRINKLEMIEGCGIEDLYFEMKDPVLRINNSNFAFHQALHCWIRNIESFNANHAHIALDRSLACEFRHNYIHHANGYGSGGQGYGISVADKSTDNLVEDNVFYYLRHSMLAQNGATGNVYGYNYSHRMFDREYPNTDTLMMDMQIHGGHATMNLAEGNVLQHMGADNWWGSDRHNTFFRNHVERYGKGGKADHHREHERRPVRPQSVLHECGRKHFLPAGGSR